MVAIGKKVAQLLRVVVPIAVLLLAAIVATEMMRSSPRASRKARERSARLVEVVTAKLTTERARVHAMGTVRAARAVELRPEVSGKIVRLGKELIPGGHFKTGQLVAQVDAADYRLAIRERESQVVRARAELRLEQGRQNVAAREYALLSGQGAGDAGSSDIALRKPQLESIRADLQAAEAALERAQLDRKRTTLLAPFNSIVETHFVERGTQVTPTTLVARLVGTDEYWVEVSVPVSQLPWIQVPRRTGDPGSPVRVCNERAWGEGKCRAGHVVRQASGLEEQGRMARLLVAVPDPLALEEDNAEQPAMILGSYVRVEIEGARDMRAAVISRNLVHDGDRVWIAKPDDTLEIRRVQIAFSDPEKVYVVDGLSQGDRLIATSLTGVVEGMPIRTGPARGAREGRPGFEGSGKGKGKGKGEGWSKGPRPERGPGTAR